MSSGTDTLVHELLELAPDAVVLGDEEYRITDVNGAACQLLGCSREELIGRSLDVFDGAHGAQSAHECPHVPGLVRQGEYRLQGCDGRTVLVETTVKVLQDGRALGFAREIGERERADRERDDLLQWMRAVLEQIPVGVALVHGPKASHFEFNAHALEMLGPPDEPVERELLGRLRTPDGSLPDPETLPIVAALRGKRVVAAEFLARNRVGGFTPIAVSAGPIVWRDEAVSGAIAAFEDITAAKELERLRAEWSSVVAHDFKQPLCTISMTAQMLARCTDDTKIVKGLEGIRAAANRLNRMVGDLTELSRLEARRLEIVRQRVDLAALVYAAAENAGLQTPDRPFDVRVQGEVPSVCADPDRIAQVLENLLANAVKYGTPGTCVAMSLGRVGDDVAIAVTNKGRTLTADEIARIFERFHRTSSAKLAGTEGAGLGLYITRSLVEAHGGRITAESTAAGVTTFRFTLPLATVC